ncbi:MAG TPA: hypothetical protein PLR99_15340 [Polyangiaceae bacterium]|nr:hypothetical protein [Polyangiaceae bacterium]
MNKPAIHKHLRLALAPLLLFACAPSSEDKGCQVNDTKLCAPDTTPTGPIALDAVAHVRGPKTNEGTTDQVATADTDQPDLLRVLDASVNVAPCAAPVVRVKALRAGTATVRFTLPDGQVTTASVEVVPAAGARLVPFLDELAAGRKTQGTPPPLESDTKEIVQLAGGKETWHVVYTSAAGSVLRGSGATTYTLPEGATSTLIENGKDRELFQLVTPKVLAPGGKLEARAANATLSVPLRVVPAEAITDVRVYVEAPPTGDGGDAGAGSKQLAVLARATDATGATVRGTPFDYTVGGAPLGEGGEIVIFKFDRSAPERPITATVPGARAKGEALIAVAPGETPTRNSAGDFASCSYAPSRGARGAGAALALGVALAGLAARRRTRRSSAATAPTK